MKKCKVSGCSRNYYAEGYCKLHYEHMRKYGRTFERPIINQNRSPICIVKGCNRTHHAKGYCVRHWQQMKNKGKIVGNIERTKFDPNEFVIEGNICRIFLYDELGNKKSEALIDAADVHLVKKYKWGQATNGYVTGLRMTIGYVILNVKPNKNIDIDHKDGNPLNNRRANLRLVTRSQNLMNARTRTDNTSGIKGVSWDKSRKRWQAYIQKDSKRIALGRFKSKKDAITKRREAENKYYGEFNPGI